jgi:hypothetical protein
MSERGVDIAWARPTVAAILATGAHWVARYLSTDSSKNLTAAEVREYAAAGLGTVVVWETTAGRATAGYAAGAADARAADAQRKGDGLPAGMPIHFAVDEDTNWASVAQYFAGAASVLGQARVGVYGGMAVIDGAYAAGFRLLWQTTAWSGGRWSSHATIRQTGGTVLGGSADVDVAEATDFGEYPRPTITTPTPPTPPEDIVTPQDKKDIAALVLAELPAALAAVPAAVWDYNLTRRDDQWKPQKVNPTLAAHWFIEGKDVTDRQRATEAAELKTEVTALTAQVAALVKLLTPKAGA